MITSTDHQLEAWACFLEEKFSARADEPIVELDNEAVNNEEIEDISLDEVKMCVSKMKSNKATGPDTIPAEQYKASPTAVNELHDVLLEIQEILDGQLKKFQMNSL